MFLFTSFTSFAQDSATLIPPKPYKVILKTKDGQFITGNLNSISNTSLSMSDKKINMQSYDIEKIIDLKIYKKGSVGRGAIIGFLTGAITGFVIGMASGDDDPKQWFAMTSSEKAFTGGILLGGAGALTGALLGLIHKKITINGQKEKYQNMKTRMAKKFQPRID